MSGPAPIRVLIADDHAPSRAEIRAALEADPGFAVCGEAADAVAAVALAVRRRPDVCLLDVRMPGSGIAATWEIASRLPATRIVMLTVSALDADLFAALRAGAHGYLLKDVDGERLTAFLQDVLRGRVGLSSELVTRLVEEFRDRSPKRRIPLRPDGERLTSREWEVLDLLRRGLETRQIASRLFLSQATVRSHVAAILRKMRATDRESVVRLVSQPLSDLNAE
jgi:DNA-binding NarL/FixJ family response regulator